ncbi:MAG: response regulator [Ruminococcus sp.]|nr:response regulator [Ruminococcus sp.]
MAYKIIVVDDDSTNLRMAEHILSKNDMDVTALRSGQALLDHIERNDPPDLILLDINMPEMDGFQTLEELRIKESADGLEETPVIFLTASEGIETETHGFEAGVSDYIKKPFNPEILLKRIDNIITRQNRIKLLRTAASTDKLTGLLNKSAAASELGHSCAGESGCLMMIDLDSFKLVNDLYGHEMGDRVLIAFSKLIIENAPEGSRCARIGGDEFAAFFKDMNGESEIEPLAEKLNLHITAEARQLMGDDMEIPLGVSIGGVSVPECGREYEKLLSLADKALYNVKQNGKHGAEMYSRERADENSAEIDSIEKELSTLSAIFGERNIPNSALRLDKQIFSSVYQYIMRYVMRSHRKACKMLLTISHGSETDPDRYEELCSEFGDHIKNCLRKSDILMRNKHDQYFVLLADIREAAVGAVISNIMGSWKELHGDAVKLNSVTEFVGGSAVAAEPEKESRVVILDSDVNEIKRMGQILSSGGFYVSAMKSAPPLFEYLKKSVPELLIIGAELPSLNCLDILNRLREIGGETADIPVLLLGSEEQSELMANGLLHGACDILHKPLNSVTLLQRVRNTIELSSLRHTMSCEVEKKLRGSRELFLNVVRSFSELIDAKDNYAHGHSVKVAELAREIAKRAGMTETRQSEIYTAALLRDVGKLNIPDSVISKPATLTNEEYELVKDHSNLGARTLECIDSMPILAAGARWHHERYGGGGYPDGLSGKDIPTEARIIAVADAYAAMTSSRTFRGSLTAAQAAEELRRGRGTQFDPEFTDIMLKIAEEQNEP